MLDEWLQLPDDETDAVVAEVTGEVALRREDGGVVTVNPFKADAKYLAFPKDRLVQVVLGSHEYLLTAIEAWAGDAVMRYGGMRCSRSSGTYPVWVSARDSGKTQFAHATERV